MPTITDLSAPTRAAFAEPERFCIQSLCRQLEHQGVAYIDEMFPKELLTRLYEEVVTLDTNKQLTPAAIGRGDTEMMAHDIRRDKTDWIDGTTLAQTAFLEQLNELRLELNKTLMLGLFEVETHFAAYHPGAFYARHCDSFQGAKNRILSLVLYLNPQWEKTHGGALELYQDMQAEVPYCRILPQWGHTVLFLSEDVPHAVAPTSRTRYSIAAWFRCQQSLPLL